MPALRSDFGVRWISLFGSTARDGASEDSDLDIPLEFEVGPTFDSFMGLKLSKVDLGTPDTLKPRVRAEVEREAIDVDPCPGASSG
jgi:predicted nucleotidyltransferase